jgi:hypothetical protein
MYRALHLAVLALLLLFAQQRAYVHPLAHLAAAPSHETALSSSQAGADCVECALLAAGSLALHGDAAAGAPGHPGFAPIIDAYRSRAAAVPRWFRSRAPPFLA